MEMHKLSRSSKVCCQEGIKHQVFEGFFLIVQSDHSHTNSIPCFCIEGVISYIGFCDDFGPMSLGSIFEFCKLLDEYLIENQGQQFALLSSGDQRTLTNAVFLLGAYMIMDRGSNPEEIHQCFEPLKKIVLAYRDVSPGEPNFALHLKDCWAGLWRAKSLGWANFGPGGFDPAEYEIGRAHV